MAGIRVPAARPRRRPKTYPVSPDASGAAVVEISPLGSYSWVIHQVSVEVATAPIGARCTLRFNDAYVTTIIATGGFATEPPTLDLDPGDRATIVFENLNPTDVGTVLVFYDEVVDPRAPS